MTDYAKWERCVVDTETDDIIYTKLWCLVVRCTVTLDVVRFVNRFEAAKSGIEWQDGWKDINEFPQWARENIKVFVAHNGIPFDFRVTKDILDFEVPVEAQEDTLVMSRLFLPQREGGHSLDAWGMKVKVEKIKFEDFSKFSLEMLSYCEQDTLVNVHVLRWLEREQQEFGFSHFSVRLEHKVRDIISQQERNGFYLDRAKATKLLYDTKKRLEDVEKEMYKVFVPQPRLTKSIVPRRTKKGIISAVGMKAAVKALKAVGMNPDTYLIGQKLAYIELEDFNLGSTKQVAERLLEIGWKPKNLTPTGLPKIDEESLAPFAAEFPQVGLLSEYLMTRSRNSLAEQWLEAVDDKGYVHGRVNTLGAITRRATHNDPNMANVPAASDNVPYGKECRSCWTVEDKENYTMVGCDASSLELRLLCHHMGDDEYTQAAVAGDIHALNMKAFRLTEDPEWLKENDSKKFKEQRDISKRLLYACVTLDTKVLTKEGWKDYFTLNVGDMVLTYNQKKNIKEWKPVLEKVYYPEAEVIEMSHSHSFKVKTTPNHRWFVKQRRQSERGWSTINGRYMENQIRTTEEINTESNIIVNAPYVGDSVSSFTYLREKWGIDWTKEVLKMSSKERQSFLQGFLLADGHVPKKKNAHKWKWNQNVNEISEGLLLASYLETPGHIYVSEKQGKNHRIITVSLGDRSWTTGQKLKKIKLENQPVWCIRTENESFVMRQGNCITITGNTLYGAGNRKLGSIVGASQKKGAELKENLLTGIPKFGSLVSKMQKQSQMGYVYSIDGGRLWTRSEHAALNTLLQGDGGIVCKLWMAFINKQAKEEGLDFKQLVWVHDEFQFQILKTQAERFGQITKDSMKKVEEQFKMNCPLDSEFKIASDWSLTH